MSEKNDRNEIRIRRVKRVKGEAVMMTMEETEVELKGKEDLSKLKELALKIHGELR
jgi:hypothetical protein